MNSQIEALIGDLANSQVTLKNYINAIESGTDENLKIDRNFQKLKRFSDGKIPAVMDFLSNNAEIIQYEDFLEDAYNNISTLRSDILSIQAKTPYDVKKIIDRADYFNSEFSILKNGVSAVKQSRDLVETSIKPKLRELENKVKDVEAAKRALEHHETDLIYLNLYNKYKTEFKENNRNFYAVLCVGVALTLYSIFLYDVPDRINWIYFISTKVLIFSVSLTLCTIYLRRSAHAKKLYEQAFQTHTEITAFPLFIRSLKDEDKDSLTKELALKYFGKELDQTQNDKIGDLMQDQLSAGTELVRASAELVRAKGGATTPP